MSIDANTAEQVKELEVDKYKYGFVTDIEMETAPKGLNEISFVSSPLKKKNRIGCLNGAKAYRHWLTMDEPDWAKVVYKIDYQDPYYYAAPKNIDRPKS